MRNVCVIEECEKLVLAHGLCGMHNARKKRHGDPLVVREQWPTGVPCRVDGCNGIAKGRGWCANHYWRYRRHGDPLGGYWPAPSDEQTKTCSRCKARKDRSEFAKRSAMKDGLRSQCKACDAAYSLARYDVEQARIKRREYYVADIEASRAYIRAKQAEMRRNNPDYRDKASAMWARRHAAFVEFVDRSVLFERDEGKCRICGEPVDPNDFHVDHIYPIARGGLHSYANTQIAHPFCNISKGAKIIERV